METKEDEWKLLYRKMLEKEIQGRKFVINIMRRETMPDENNPHSIKIMLFETNSGT